MIYRLISRKTTCFGDHNAEKGENGTSPTSVIFVNENENENEKDKQFVHENEN